MNNGKNLKPIVTVPMSEFELCCDALLAEGYLPVPCRRQTTDSYRILGTKPEVIGATWRHWYWLVLTTFFLGAGLGALAVFLILR
jgi:hypothetical protein